MSSVFKSSVLWQFVGGFALGAAALAVAHPGEARAAVIAPVVQAAR